MLGLPGADDWGDALGHLYSTVKHVIAPETPLWPLDSPVGTERVGGDTSVGMPDPNVSPVIGLLGDHPVTAAANEQAQRLAGAMSQFGPADVGAIRAFHGSPADFSAFDDRYIGTGEGNQAYGYGHYAAESEGVARSYRDAPVYKSIQEYNERNPGDRAGQVAEWIGAGVPSEQIDPALATLEPQSTQAARDEWVRAGLKLHDDMQAKGHMYEVNIDADPEHMLDWDKPLSEQHPVVQQALQDIHSDKVFSAPDAVTQLDNGRYALSSGGNVVGRADGWPDKSTADYVLKMLQDDAKTNSKLTAGQLVSKPPAGMTPESYAQELQAAGVPGIKYLDQSSRAAGQGTSNYVVFDPATIAILRKYGIAGLIAGGGAAAATQGQEQ